MRYSVWNSAHRGYDYYVAPGSPQIHAGAPPKTRQYPLGSTVERAAWRLPSGARKIGQGTWPQGRIASMGDPGDAVAAVPQWLIYAAISLAAWKVFK
jgi:hypothetical protein